MPIKYGVVGTNWISDSWVQLAGKTGKWQLHAVYSRKHDSAEAFGSKYHCTTLYTSLADLAADQALQAVYIASPNGLHYTQAKQMLIAGKHVILEKPATSNPAELDDLFSIAKEKGVYLIEAYRHIQEANYKLLKRYVVEEKKLGPIHGASFRFADYSSRYTAVLAGETPNVFSREFSGGSLLDVGVYPVTFAVALFGKPRRTTYVPHICRTGVDASGLGILHYDNFGVQINCAKSYQSRAPCEIWGEEGTVSFAQTVDLRSLLHYHPRTQETRELAGPWKEAEKPHVNMEEEAAEFGRIIEERDTRALAELERISRDVLEVITDMRTQAGIIYPADKQ